jgi:cytolysin-activating lysine-acyltransferase
MRLHPDKWTSGDQLWVVEVIAPFGGAEAMVADLKEKVFPTREIKMLVAGADGVRKVRAV